MKGLRVIQWISINVYSNLTELQAMRKRVQERNEKWITSVPAVRTLGKYSLHYTSYETQAFEIFQIQNEMPKKQL